MSTLAIIDLVDICARERARSTSLFEHLGRWVPTIDSPALQRLLATAAHRHAWHAGLWEERTPTIAVTAIDAGVAAISEAGDDVDRWTAYATALGLLIAELDDVRSRVDPDLDPGTTRVIELVLRDARELAAAVTAVAPA